MQRTYSWPEGHWNWPITVNHKHGVRCGDMIWFGGQVDLDPAGNVLHADDLPSQVQAVVGNIARVLNDLSAGLTDLVSLTCFYVNGGDLDEAEFLATLAASLPNGVATAVTAVPIPWLAYEGMRVEIEGVAMASPTGGGLERQTHPGPWTDLPGNPFRGAVRCGKMIFVSAQSPLDDNGQLVTPGDILPQSEQVARNISAALAAFGADFDDVVKTNRWYSGAAGIDDFEPAALSFAANFSEPGPAATGIPLPRHADDREMIRIAVIAMRGEDGERLPRQHSWPDSLWDWHVHLPYQHGVRCGDLIFLGGQVSLDRQGRAVNPGDLSAQTHQAMAHIGTLLQSLGASYDDTCKVLALYQGDCGAEALHSNLPIRSSYFSDPGPATTGIPLPALAYDSMVIEIDIYAMVDPAR